jgi:hypothetical protein
MAKKLLKKMIKKEQAKGSPWCIHLV